MLIVFISDLADMFLASSDHSIIRFGHFTMNARNQSYIFECTLGLCFFNLTFIMRDRST